MVGKEVTAICKRCGRPSAADKFVLDPIYKMVVCPSCIAERKSKSNTGKKIGENALGSAIGSAESTEKPVAPAKPKGWDSEDDYLDRAYKEKRGNAPVVERMSDGRAKYQCKKCKYKFAYDAEKKQPANCPYCGTPVTIGKLY
jgi:DNA-directed RNA polymerase subunit RPC12/RpoP